MHNKAQAEGNGIWIVILALIVVGIFILYFLSKTMVTVGWIGLFLGAIGIIIGGYNGEDKVFLIGLIIFAVSLILLGIGYTGVNFFEKNPTGSGLLEGANTIKNATVESYKAGAEVYSSIKI